MTRNRFPVHMGFTLSLTVLSCSPPEVPLPGAPGPPALEEGPIQFREEAKERGVVFLHAAKRTEERLMPEILGGSVAIADFNRDGAPDLYFVNGGDLAAKERPRLTKDRLYLNDGQGQFRDVSEEWAVGGGAYGMGVACGDFDNDGWIDLLLTTYGGGERLMRNTGTRFEDVTAAAGLEGGRDWGTSAGFFDCDGDGDLDAYVVRYVEYDVQNALPCLFNGRQTYCSPGMFVGLADCLWLNNGDGTFADASLSSGIGAQAGKGLALALGDVDWDGDVDIYVANDSTRNLLFINDGTGVFADRAGTSGVAYDETGRAAAGMGADYSDVDGNGMQDIVCTNFQDETSNIYLQKPAGVFRDRSYAMGVGSSGQQRLSFGVDFFDFDNDGDEDLFVANGHIDDGVSTVSTRVTFAQQDSLYRLDGGREFVEISGVAGKALRKAAVSRGVASADLDGDGLLDLVLMVNSDYARLLMNTSGVEGRQAVVLWLEGNGTNRSAIGARLEIEVAGQMIRREVRGASSFMSQCDLRVHIGLGAEGSTDKLSILWPGGERQDIGSLSAGFYHVIEGEQPAPFVPGESVIAPR